MKIRNDFVTNSSSTSYIFVGKGVDAIIDEIRDRMIFGGYNDQFLTELQKEGFYEILDRTQLNSRIWEMLHWWVDIRYGASDGSYSANINEVINKAYLLDDKIILKVKINWQGDGHDHACIRDNDWYRRMDKSGMLELVEGIFEEDFWAFFIY